MAIYHIYPSLPIIPTISFHFLLTYANNLKTFSHRPPSTSNPHHSPPPTLTIFTSGPFFHHHCPLLPLEPPRSSAVSPPSPVFSIWHSNFHRRISPLNPHCRRLDRHCLWHHTITTLITTIATCGKCSLSTALLSSPRPNHLVSDFPLSFCFNRFNHLFLYSISFERGRMINLLPFSLSLALSLFPFHLLDSCSTFCHSLSHWLSLCQWTITIREENFNLSHVFSTFTVVFSPPTPLHQCSRFRHHLRRCWLPRHRLRHCISQTSKKNRTIFPPETCHSE